jgi:tetratricopeptide (TPR) repeat protein
MPGAPQLLRPLAWCLGLGAAATALAPVAGVAVPAALAALVVGGAAGNFGHELCQALQHGVMAKLLSRRSGLAENHVVVQALRHAQLAALHDLRQRFDAAHAAQTHDPAHVEALRFSARLADFVAEQTKAAKTLSFVTSSDLTPEEDALRQQVLVVLPDAFDQGLAARRAANEPAAFAESFAQFRHLVEHAVLAELALSLWSPGETPPAPFSDLFNGSPTRDGWFGLFLRAAADRLKAASDNDGAFAAIWAAEQAALVKAIVESHTALLRDIKSDTAAIRAAQETEAAANERRHRELMRAIAGKEGVDPRVLAPLFAHLGKANLTLDQMRAQAESAIADMLARAHQPVPPSKDGADIAATIAAARAHMGSLDSAAARALLDAKLAEDEKAHRQRRLPLLRERAAAERFAYDHTAAEATLREILILDPDDFWTWIERGDLYKRIGSLESAAATYQQAFALATRRAQLEPGAARWQRHLSVSNDRVGDVQVAQGNLGAALTSYLALRETAKRLSLLDPGTAQWQSDLAVSYNKFGDVQVVQGDLRAARANYEVAQEIRTRLLQREPGNAEWQLDLSVSQERIGDMQSAQGDLGAALVSYLAALKIRTHLSQSDPSNTAWQNDLSVSHTKVGNAERAQGNLGAALASYRASYEIFARLSQADPGNTEWQRHLSVSHSNIGYVLAAQGDFGAALSSHRAARQIRTRLSEADPNNTVWQRDLSVSYNMIGDAHADLGDLDEALVNYRVALAIRVRLSRSDPSNVEWQHDLSVLHNRVGDAERAQGHLGSALASYRAALEIALRLSKSDLCNVEWQQGLAMSYERMGEIHVEQKKTSDAAHYFTQALAIYDELTARNRTDIQSCLLSVIPHWRLASVDPASAAHHLDAALAILEPLAATQRLDANRTTWIPRIKAQRAALGAS